jgi:transposase
MRSTIGRPRALTQEQVDLILAWYDAVRQLKTLRQLAKELGVAPSTVYNVIRRRGEFKQPPRASSEANAPEQREGSKPASKQHPARAKRKGPR